MCKSIPPDIEKLAHLLKPKLIDFSPSSGSGVDISSSDFPLKPSGSLNSLATTAAAVAFSPDQDETFVKAEVVLHSPPRSSSNYVISFSPVFSSSTFSIRNSIPPIIPPPHSNFVYADLD